MYTDILYIAIENMYKHFMEQYNIYRHIFIRMHQFITELFNVENT